MTIFVAEHETMMTGSTEVDVPGVEVVLRPRFDAEVFDAATLKRIGALHRRMWNRRDAMMRRRGLDDVRVLPDSIDQLELEQPRIIADLADAQTWHQRLDSIQIGRFEIASGTSSPDAVVRTRGWDESEAGVLVDGRPVIAAVFDVAVMLSIAVEEFRRGEEPFVFAVPEPDDVDAAKLWDELVSVAQDRLGIERGTVRYSSQVRAS